MKFKLSVVAIFKNEHRFIVQWIEFHLKVGVDHFYLYDNGGDHWELLEPFQQYITYTPWTDQIASEYKTNHQNPTRQKSAYTHCVDHFRSETKWIQLLDLDEFLVPLSGNDVKKCLNEEEEKSVGVLRVPRFNFGNSDNWKRQEVPNSSLYNRRERRASHFKDLGKMSEIGKIKNPHLIKAKGEIVTSTKLCIHHHYTRSLSEWMSRSKTGGGQAGKGFRWFIGQHPLLAFLTYAFLNVRSSYPLRLIALLSGMVLLLDVSFWWMFLNIPFVIWTIFAWQRGQNEVMDERMKELLKS